MKRPAFRMGSRRTVIPWSDEFDIRFQVGQIADYVYQVTMKFDDISLREEMQDSAGLMQTACRQAFAVEDLAEVRRLLYMTRGKQARIRSSVHLCHDLHWMDESDYSALYLLLRRLSHRLKEIADRIPPDPEDGEPLDLPEFDDGMFDPL